MSGLLLQPGSSSTQNEEETFIQNYLRLADLALQLAPPPVRDSA